MNNINTQTSTRVRSMPLPVGFGNILVFGGPFEDAPTLGKGVLTIRLESSIKIDPTINLPIQDFAVPDASQTSHVQNAVEQMLEAAIRGDIVYVGCLGGTGRTGMVLALALRELGYTGQEAIDYVRKHYKPHAIETWVQESYVQRYRPVLSKAKRLKIHVRAFFGISCIGFLKKIGRF